MQVIKPITIGFTTGQLVSSTIPEPDPVFSETAWNAATAYSIGDLAYRSTTHRIYKRLVAGTTATTPELDTTNWVEYAPTNRWAMFDQQAGTASREIGTGAVLTVQVDPLENVNSLALLEVVGVEVFVQVRQTGGGTIVYSETVSLDNTVLLDWYGYFFEEFSYRNSLVLKDLPPYPTARILVTVTGVDEAAIGNMVVGNAKVIGENEYGTTTAGIRDYSRKTVNAETGIVSLEQRKFAKTLRTRFKLNELQVNYVHKLLADLRATPCVWQADNDYGLEPLIVYGFYRDFTLDLAHPTIAYYSLDIEGMI